MLSQSQWEPLVTEGQVLRDRLIVALPVRDVQVGEVIRVQEEHVLGLREILETRGVVWEFVARIGGGGVAKENALHSFGKFSYHFRVVTHYVTVAGVGDQDELALGEGFEDLLQQKFANGECGRDIAKVERPGIEGATRVGAVDELHVVSGDLLGGCSLNAKMMLVKFRVVCK